MSSRKPKADPRAAARQPAARAGVEDAILRAAEAEFAEKGYEGATTAAIAARAGLPKANLHYYVATKEALYRRVVAGVLDAWLAEARSFDGGASAVEALTRYIEGKMELARARPLGSRIFAREIMSGAPMVGDFLDTTLAEWVRVRGAIVEGWIAQGQLRPLDPKLLFYMIWATTQHYADFSAQIAALNGGAALDDDAFDGAKRQVVETILRGIAPVSG